MLHLIQVATHVTGKPYNEKVILLHVPQVTGHNCCPVGWSGEQNMFLKEPQSGLTSLHTSVKKGMHFTRLKLALITHC